jgi:hypothetical protein
VTTTGSSDVYYDTYDVGINADPYPVYRRLREGAPVYYNDTARTSSSTARTSRPGA